MLQEKLEKIQQKKLQSKSLYKMDCQSKNIIPKWGELQILTHNKLFVEANKKCGKKKYKKFHIVSYGTPFKLVMLQNSKLNNINSFRSD